MPKKNYKQLYTKLIKAYDKIDILNDGLEDRLNTRNIIIFFLSVGVIFLGMGFVAALDNIDQDDILGPYMCEQHGLEFDKVESDYMTMYERTSDLEKEKSLKIYCKEAMPEEPVDDGYLVIIK